MFEEHRRYNSCVFCGGTQLTKEHVFGKALARIHPVNRNWQVFYLDSTSGRVQKKKGSSPILSVTMKALCSRCNTGRLSREVDNALPHLEKLIGGEATILDVDSTQAVRRYWEKVGLLADISSSNYQISESDKEKPGFKQNFAHRLFDPLIGDSERKGWASGMDTPRIRIFVGRHFGVLGINPEVNTAYYPPPPYLVSMKRVSFVIGKLAVLVEVGDRVSVAIPRSFVELREQQATTLNENGASYDDCFSVRGQDIQTVAIRAILRYPDVVKDHEEHAKVVNGFSCPPKHLKMLDGYGYAAAKGILPWERLHSV